MYRKHKTPKIQKTHWTAVTGGSIGFTPGDGYVAIADGGLVVASTDTFHAAQEALNAYLTAQARQEVEQQQIQRIAQEMALFERSDEMIAAYERYVEESNSPLRKLAIIAAYAAIVGTDTHDAAHRISRWQLAYINANGGAW